MSNLVDNLQPRKSFLEKNQEQLNNQNLTTPAPQIKTKENQLLKKIAVKTKHKQLSFRLSDDLYNKIEGLAKSNKVSMNKAIEHCLDQFFKNI